MGGGGSRRGFLAVVLLVSGRRFFLFRFVSHIESGPSSDVSAQRADRMTRKPTNQHHPPGVPPMPSRQFLRGPLRSFVQLSIPSVPITSQERSIRAPER